MRMGFFAWLVMGLIAGFIASKLVYKQGEGVFMEIVLGIIGAVVGGFIADGLGLTGITGFDLYSILVSVVGAVIVLMVYHAMTLRGSV